LATSAERFRQSDAVFRSLVESSPGLVVFALDRQYRYLAFNQNHAHTMQRLRGARVSVGIEMLGLFELESERERARVNFDRALGGESFTLLEEHGEAAAERRYSEDRYSPVRDDAGQIVGLSVCVRDITEQRRAGLELDRQCAQLEAVVKQRTAELSATQEQLLHAQKLESLGILASGIAHDFNNLLAIMLARTELYFREAPEGLGASDHVCIVRDTAFEARMLTRQLLDYAGKGKPQVEALDLNGVVQNMAQLLRASIGKDIRLELEPGSGVVAVQGDDTQLRQVLLNLVSNAAEAIGNAVGKVVIRTGVSEVSSATPERRWFAGELANGSYAYLEVEDSGSGITSADRERIFDAFFTTKLTGRGLGLAAVLGIVKGHRGTVLVDSRPGSGSRFRVLLPAVSTGRVPGPVAPARRRAGLRASGCVLVVDDEAAVRAATVAILSSAGYRVLEAEGGEAAQRLFRRHSLEIDVVLLDLAMPGVNGEQTLHALRQIRSDVPIVLLTAYAEDELRLRAIRDDLAGFVAKPFSYEELLSAVKGATIPTSGYMLRAKNNAAAYGE
jgi:signal transduction histidine kinase/CheY-like chemotaxis protein